MSARTCSWLVLVGFGLATVVAAWLLTPWRPLTQHPAPAGMQPDLRPSSARDFSTQELARAASYSANVRLPLYASMIVTLLVALVLGLTTLGGKIIAGVAAPLGGGWWWQIILGSLALGLISTLVVLPLSARAQVVRKRFGLSGQSWGGWAGDQVKTWLVNTVILLVIIVIVMTLIRWLPAMWPLAAAVIVALLVVALSFLFPVIIEPVFNHFTPMPDSPLRASLLQLAQREGVQVSDVLVADASRRTNAVNAYVSGIGSTRRIVIYDNLLTVTPPEETRIIVAHELAHARYHDVARGTAIGALAAAVGVGLLGLVLTSTTVTRWAGVPHPHDPRALALALLTLTVILTVSAPMQMVISRRIETRADIAALAATSDAGAFTAMQRRLALRNLSDPTPPTWVYLLSYSHPTSAQRIELARAWARALGVPEPPGAAQ